MKLLKIKHFVIFITFVFFSCKDTPLKLQEIKGEQFTITEKLSSVDSLETVIDPYRQRLNQIMDSVLTYAPRTLNKEDGQLNTSEGNLMADIILRQANKVFQQRTGNSVDFVVLNHGGIRSVISKGPVTIRNIFEVMPFENNIAIVAMQGRTVRDLISFLVNAKRAHPISGLQITLDKEGGLASVFINGEPFDENKKYYVATSDYLVQGGDDMGFFKNTDEVIELNYLVRNAIIDYLKEIDTLNATVDNRFIRLK
ncbi:MAG: hypothetical protein CMH48_00400 [Muricauda sp.]|nr:5'-nucleotidase [Allomuricauda sp.]MAU26227.1 hypothetical protein [Allomuricauda sp.]MBC29280.1 hypothetical protein [Allomuricauda sp.]